MQEKKQCYTRAHTTLQKLGILLQSNKQWPKWDSCQMSHSVKIPICKNKRCHQCPDIQHNANPTGRDFHPDCCPLTLHLTRRLIPTIWEKVKVTGGQGLVLLSHQTTRPLNLSFLCAEFVIAMCSSSWNHDGAAKPFILLQQTTHSLRHSVQFVHVIKQE